MSLARVCHAHGENNGMLAGILTQKDLQAYSDSDSDSDSVKAMSSPARPPASLLPAAPPHTTPPGPWHPVGRVDTYITKPNAMTRRFGSHSVTMKGARTDK